MDTIRTTVTIPADRRLRVEVTVPEGIPPGRADVVLVISPVPRGQEGTRGAVSNENEQKTGCRLAKPRDEPYTSSIPQM